MDVITSGWPVWLIVMAVLFIIELLSGAVVALCLGIGCLAGALCSFCGLAFWLQVTVAALASVAALIVIGPYINKKNHGSHSAKSYRSNMDALIGRVGKVKVPVTHHSDDNGRVQIDGDSWLAYTDDQDVPLTPGTQVKVEAYNSLVLKVRPLKADAD